MTAYKRRIAAAVFVALALAGVAGGWLMRHWNKLDSQAAVLPTSPAPADVPAADNPDPFGQLKSGITVALVGVGNNPSYTRPWWHSDGSPLESAPYAQAVGSFGDSRPGRLTREFAFAYDAQSIPGATDVVVTAAGSDGNITDLACDRGGRSIPNLIGAASDLPDRPATVRFNLAGRPWKTLLQTPATGGSSLGQDRLTIGPVHADGSRLAVDVTTADAGSIDTETDLIAIDATGVEHRAGPYHRRGPSRSNAKDWSEVFHFRDLALQTVRTLHYQTRTFGQWVEFRNVSIRPGQKTAVTVATSDAPAGGP